MGNRESEVKGTELGQDINPSN